ncbi:serpin family protein [Myxococcota bacterium]|nr:serpin family protein [Myxococcota bacterium]MBU1380099.1 serpin family protein [Myxococcota bacterium]MBU1496095.1 serpin family protein [Myxococcota bacterium]
MKRLLIFLIILSTLISCSEDEKTTSEIPFLKSDIQRNTGLLVTDQAVLSQAVANNDFAMELYRNTAATKDDNAVFSPFSISMAFAMQWAGAVSQTELQIADVMNFGSSQQALHSSMGTLDQHMDAIGSDPAGDFRLSVVNASWVRPDTHVEQSFLDTLAQYYDAAVYLADFENDTDNARKLINQWVMDNTNDTIKDLLPATMNETLINTFLVLTNAIYLKAEWNDEFNATLTETEDFHAPTGTVSCEMMHQENIYRTYDATEYVALELPYKGDKASMLVIMPDDGLFSQFEQTMGATLIGEIDANMTAQFVNLYFPKFRIEYDITLNNPLKAMGMNTPFNPETADFSGFHGGTIDPFFIQVAIHKAFIACDEKGTEAGAATAIVSGNNSVPPAPLRFDRPFIYLIRDNQTKSILFMGKVTNPS